MKNSIKIILVFVCIFFTAIYIHAQDLMYLRSTKNPIKVKVIEIGLDEIKYRPWGDTITPILSVPRVSVSKIVQANGAEFSFKENPMMDAVNYAEQNHSAIKINFLSPLYTHLALSYERSVKPGASYEISLGLIGIGVHYDKNSTYSYSSTPLTDPKGFFLRLGYKFITSPDFYLRGMKYAHILKGGYIKPEIVIGNYGITRPNYNYYSYYAVQSERRSVTFGAVMINFGKQWIMDDVFAFDIYCGVGYGTSNYSRIDYSNYNDGYGPEFYHYAFLGGWDYFPIALTAGMKIGFLFGKPGLKENISEKK